MIKQVWNISPLAPHFSPLPRFFVFAVFFSYIVDTQWFKSLCIVLARPLYYINRTTLRTEWFRQGSLNSKQ